MEAGVILERKEKNNVTLNIIHCLKKNKNKPPQPKEKQHVTKKDTREEVREWSKLCSQMLRRAEIHALRESPVI